MLGLVPVDKFLHGVVGQLDEHSQNHRSVKRFIYRQSVTHIEADFISDVARKGGHLRKHLLGRCVRLVLAVYVFVIR